MTRSRSAILYFFCMGFLSTSSAVEEKILPTAKTLYGGLASIGLADFDRHTELSITLGGQTKTYKEVELCVNRAIKQYVKLLGHDKQGSVLGMLNFYKGPIIETIFEHSRPIPEQSSKKEDVVLIQ